MLARFPDLPADLRKDAVRPYYEALHRKRFSLFVKRAFDIAASAVLLLLFSPAMLVIAVLVARSSPGPVFFRQDRVTRYGRMFRIYKFRTMADRSAGAQVTIADDPRITPIGKSLRSRRLDELPQLINILLGDMSFVGTRPEVFKYVEAYNDEMRATLLLRAGLTSKASLLYRDEDQLLAVSSDPEATYVNEILPAKMRINLDALMGFSLREDFLTLMHTFGALFGG